MFGKLAPFPLFCFLFLLFTKPITASVVINEIFPAPDTGNEWIELYNTGPETVSLTDWQLEDQLSTPTTIHTFGDHDIAGFGFAKIDLASAKLNNSGDGVTLKNVLGEIVDTMTYDSSQANMSWSRIPDGVGAFSLTEATPGVTNGVPPSPSPSPTPSPSPSLSPTPSPSPSPASSPIPPPTLALTEIMACPASGDTEWIELYNPTDQTVSINSWQIRDTSNTSKVVSGTIRGHQYTILSWSGSLLNNTGDSITLLTDSNQLVATAQFAGCQSGQSFVWQNDAWTLSMIVSKGFANPVSASVEHPMAANQETKLSVDNSYLQEPSPYILGSSQVSSLETPSDPPVSSLSAQIPPPTLEIPTSPPFISDQNTIDISQPIFSKWGVVNVILGGILITASGFYLTHENNQH